MSRRVKLTTEWAEWTVVGDCATLAGADDHAAFISRGTDGKYKCSVYTDAMPRNAVWIYELAKSADVDFGKFASMEEAQNVCMEKLIEVGLVDILWWATRHAT